MKTNRKEAPVLKEVIKLFRDKGLYFQRLNTTGIPMNKGGRIVLIPNPDERGTADGVCHIPAGGIFCVTIYVETKREKGGIQSPDQKWFEYRVTRAGALYWLVNDVKECEEKLDEVLLHIHL